MSGNVFKLPYNMLKDAAPGLPDYPTSTTILHFWTPVELTAAVEEQAKEHPFDALVTYAGRPSDSPVGGTEKIKGGPYKVLIPAELMARKIGDLRGKRVFAAETLETHTNSADVGVFTKAWVEKTDQSFGGSAVLAARATGLLFRDRRPSLVARVIDEARADRMGLSYDIKDVVFRLAEFEGEKVLVVSNFSWRGATVLKRQSAAYKLTQLAAHSVIEEEIRMEAKDLQAAMEVAFNKFNADVIKPLSDRVGGIESGLEDKAKLAAQSIADKVVEKIDSISVRVEELSAAATAKEEPTVPPKAESDEGGIKVVDFIAQIGAEFKKALEPVAEKLDKIGQPDQKTGGEGGVRRTLSASGLALLEKYQLGGDDRELTTETLDQALEAVKSDGGMSRAKKEQALAGLGAAKRRFIRQQRLRQELGLD